MPSIRRALVANDRRVPNSRPTVLLLDDFPDSCDAVAAWVEMDGWAPIPTSSSEAALLVLGRQRVIAVVMEPYLRAGQAMHVAQAARTCPSGAPLMVAMSANGRQGDPTGYEPTLFDFNLVKPVPMEVLAEILRPLRGS